MPRVDLVIAAKLRGVVYTTANLRGTGSQEVVEANQFTDEDGNVFVDEHGNRFVDEAVVFAGVALRGQSYNVANLNGIILDEA